MNPKDQLTTFKFLERLWLVGAFLGMICVVYFIITKDNDSALFFFGFFILSSVIYLMRKRQRKRHEVYLNSPKTGERKN
jgi:uncharacterized membrane protein YfcA